jgi:predicted nucleic acid-binding Zn finger protein
MAEGQAELRAQLPEFEKYGKKLDRAVDAVLTGGVKEARFLPSGRRVVTVVGRLGDEFVDPEKPYCSCSNFFFRVLGGREEICYHLLSYKVAKKLGRVDVVEFSDEEYGQYFAATVGDVFEVLRKSGS